jgi:hypothetical protein
MIDSAGPPQAFTDAAAGEGYDARGDQASGGRLDLSLSIAGEVGR